jgi:hypothetical protein
MKINLSEIKKWGDLKTEFLHMLNFCLDNWKNNDVKNSIEYNTLLSYNFIKKDIFNLKAIELFDEFLLDIVLENLLKRYNMKETNNNIRIDIQRFASMTEQEIIELGDNGDDIADIKSTIYYKSLKDFGLIDNKGDIIVNILNKYPNAKRFFINDSLLIIKTYGIEYNPVLLTALFNMKVIEE